jgi:hypothetical protein
MKSTVTKTFFFVALPAALTVVALVFAGMEVRRFLLNSPRFAIQSVELVTEGAASKAEILRRLGYLEGANIFQVELAEVQKKVEEDPWVYSATVIRALPNKIQIHYVPQVAKAILGADSMYYLNSEGKPFYRIRQGDSLQFPLIQVDGKAPEAESLRQRVEVGLQIIDEFRKSELFSEKDLGDVMVRASEDGGDVPVSMSLRFPPKKLAQKKDVSSRLYTASFGRQNLSAQVRRWEAVVRYLAQQSKTPKLIRLELGKKVVVKLNR